jgi:hypothetical protein
VDISNLKGKTSRLNKTGKGQQRNTREEQFKDRQKHGCVE